MASGRSATREGSDSNTESLSNSLEEASFVTLLSLPHPRHLVAATVLARAATGPFRIRVLDRATGAPTKPEGLLIGTDPAIAEADLALSPMRPVEQATAVFERLGGSPIDDSLMKAINTGDGSDSPGIVCTHDNLARSIGTSLRWYGPLTGADIATIDTRLEEAGLPQSVGEVSGDTTLARRLASWVSMLALEATGRPMSASEALDRLFTPTYLEDAPIPTAEGLYDLLWLTCATDPGLALAACLDTAFVDTALTRFDAEATEVHAAVGRLPVDRDEPIAVASTDAVALEPIAWLWTAYRLQQPYGVIIDEGNPSRVAVASTGPRSASALVEALVTSLDGIGWGDASIAGGFIDGDSQTIARTLNKQL